MNVMQWCVPSAIGPFYLLASDQGLQAVSCKPHAAPMLGSLSGDNPATKILQQTAEQLAAYLDGQLESFDVPFDIAGTEFQQRVWQQLCRIPYGQTVAYQDIAQRIENPKAVRAVGAANGKNPICIIIPCHRVIAADGTLGGYSGGLQVKSKLLALEQKRFRLT